MAAWRVAVGLLALMAAGEARAAALECRETADGRAPRLYHFDFDPPRHRLTVSVEPAAELGVEFPSRWRVLWSNAEQVVATSVDDTGFPGPVHVVFLNLARPAMAVHRMDGARAPDAAGQRTQRCRRLE